MSENKKLSLQSKLNHADRVPLPNELSNHKRLGENVGLHVSGWSKSQTYLSRGDLLPHKMMFYVNMLCSRLYFGIFGQIQCALVILMDQGSPKRLETHRGKELQKKRRFLHSGQKGHIFTLIRGQSHNGLKFTLPRNEVTIVTKKYPV